MKRPITEKNDQAHLGFNCLTAAWRSPYQSLLVDYKKHRKWNEAPKADSLIFYLKRLSKLLFYTPKHG